MSNARLLRWLRDGGWRDHEWAAFNKHAGDFISSAFQTAPHRSTRDLHPFGSFFLIKSLMINKAEGLVLVIGHVNRLARGDWRPTWDGWHKSYRPRPEVEEPGNHGPPRPSSSTATPLVQANPIEENYLSQYRFLHNGPISAPLNFPLRTTFPLRNRLSMRTLAWMF